MQEKTLEEEFNEKFNNINIAVVTIESTEGTVSQQPAQDRLLDFIFSREEKAREEGRKEAYRYQEKDIEFAWGKREKDLITQYKEELLSKLPEEKKPDLELEELTSEEKDKGVLTEKMLRNAVKTLKNNYNIEFRQGFNECLSEVKKLL